MRFGVVIGYPISSQSNYGTDPGQRLLERTREAGSRKRVSLTGLSRRSLSELRRSARLCRNGLILMETGAAATFRSPPSAPTLPVPARSASIHDVNNPSWADILSAVTAAASAVFTLGLLILAVVAWRTAHSTLEESRKASLAAQKSALAAEAANEQLRRDSAEQTRPYVFAEVVPGLAGVATWDIRITNAGRSSARELTIKPNSWPDRDDVAIQSLRELCETPRTLPPGCSIRVLWGVEKPGPGETVVGEEEMGMMPERGSVQISYRGDGDGSEWFEDRFDINTRGAGLWPVPEDGPEPNGLSGDLRKFYRLGQALTRRVGELGR